MLIRLALTCKAFPEQYDAYDEDGQQVGYLRLRHGRFSVEVPDVGERKVFEAAPEGQGSFTDEERAGYLQQAVDAIGQALGCATPVRYTIDGWH